MSETKPLQHRLLNDLTQNVSVAATAVVLALVALLFSPLGFAFDGRFLLAMSFLTLVYVYEEYWPVTYSTAYAVLWTVGAVILTASAFTGVYELALSWGTGALAVAVAFLVTVSYQYGLGILYSRTR